MKLFHWIQDLNSTDQTNSAEDDADPSGRRHEPRLLAPVLRARLGELQKMPVTELMIPRAVVMALDADVQLRRVRRLKSSKTVYFPVYKGDLDHILGWISKQKVLDLLNEPIEDVQLSQYLRRVGEVPDTANVAQLADEFLQSSSPFLVVKNSQGSTVGIIPLSEFVELVFGFEMDAPTAATTAEFTAPLLRSHEI